MFENKQIRGYTYATRFIASWCRSGGGLKTRKDLDNFHEWLLSLGLDKEDISSIEFLAKNGKVELEYSAKVFLEQFCY